MHTSWRVQNWSTSTPKFGSSHDRSRPFRVLSLFYLLLLCTARDFFPDSLGDRVHFEGQNTNKNGVWLWRRMHLWLTSSCTLLMYGTRCKTVKWLASQSYRDIHTMLAKSLQHTHSKVGGQRCIHVAVASYRFSHNPSLYLPTYELSKLISKLLAGDWTTDTIPLAAEYFMALAAVCGQFMPGCCWPSA
jgi:hypothetical protein